MRPWTKKHRVEAWEALARAATKLARAGALARAKSVIAAMLWSANSEAHLRDGLDEANLTSAQIEREVRRVRDLAEGRRVRETRVEMRSACAECDGTGSVPDEEEGDCPGCDQVIPVTCPTCKGARTKRVKVTRIRRAT